MRNHRVWLFLMVFSAVFTLASTASATTYYIAANGSDSSDGTSKSTPWAHAPGMSSCTATCASVTPQPGDHFILKGGDTWHYANFFWWHWTWNGTAANRIYIGVDKTWYAGSSWTRPVLNGDGNDFGAKPAFIAMGGSYVTVDDIEFTGLYTGGTLGSWNNDAYFSYETSTYVTVENCYFHGWSHGASSKDNMHAAVGDSHVPSENTGSVFAYNVVDGSDSTNGGDSGAAVKYGPPIIYGNRILNVSNALITTGTDIHDNTIGPVNASFDSSVHENSIEMLGDPPGGAGVYVYNNLLEGATAVNFWLLGSTGGSSGVPYVFNNVMANTDNSNVFNLCGHSPATCSGTFHVFNNTIECGRDSGPGALCIGNSISDGTINDLEANNNHLISSGAYYSCLGVRTCNTGANNTEQTKSKANGQGYTLSNLFEPTAGTNSTVGTGANLTSVCTGMAAAASGYGDAAAAETACQKGTTAGVGYDTTNHTVIYPNKTPVGRPSSGAWDVGAYRYGGGTATPNPPTGLTAVVQ